MTDLPIPMTPPAPVARNATANAPSRNTTERDGMTPSSAATFQDALAQEVGVEPDGGAVPDSDTAATAATAAAAAIAAAAAKTGIDITTEDDALQLAEAAVASIAADAAAAFVNLPVVPAEIPLVPSALPGAAGIAAALGLPGTFVPPPTRAQSGAERGMLAREPRALGILAHADGASTDLRPRPETQSSAITGAADFAAAGKFLAATTTELRREAAFDRSLLDPVAPAAPNAVHAYAAPGQSTQVPTAALTPPVASPDWNQGLGDRLVWMAGQKHQVAELRLNPPDLGPLTVTLTLDNDKASAQFFSAHAVVRDAIETAMPRLREMLADSGITLGNTNVSAEPFREPAQQQEQRSESRAYRGADAAGADTDTVTRGSHLLRSARGLVDTFA